MERKFHWSILYYNSNYEMTITLKSKAYKDLEKIVLTFWGIIDYRLLTQNSELSRTVSIIILHLI